jgi:hypothetical protein
MYAEENDKAYKKNQARSKLKHLLRALGLRTIPSDFEDAMLELMRSIETDMYGKPNILFMSSTDYDGFKKHFGPK